MQSTLSFHTDFDPETGKAVPVTDGLVRVTAPNASAYTFTGTNSFIVGHDAVAIIDPGPDDDRHLAALMAAVAGRPVVAILITHTHKDHCALARRLKAETGAPLWFEGPHRLSRPKRRFEINPLVRSSDWKLVPDRKLSDGETIGIGGVTIEVIATPGHCANHISFGMSGTTMLLTGDVVMGWNSTLVAAPDGSMDDYFNSLDRLLSLPWTQYVPAHGGEISDAKDYVRALKAHREKRNTQILELVAAAGEMDALSLRAKIYPNLPTANLPAALMTLNTHLDYLADEGKLKARWGLRGRRYRLTG